MWPDGGTLRLMANQTSASIVVAMPRADVMAVIADLPAYPQWISAIRSADVLEIGDGGRPSRVRMHLDAGVVRDSFVLAYGWEGDRSVRWDLAEPGSVVSVMSGGYLLADSDGGTEVTYDLTVDVRIPMLGMLKRRAEKAIIDTALKGLKKRAEAGGGDGT
jgi:polyketide cyclase/dehydrase/lipid transport protein